MATKKRKAQDDANKATSGEERLYPVERIIIEEEFTGGELDFRRFSREEQKEMGEIIKNFFADPSNFEDLKDPWDEEEE